MLAALPVPWLRGELEEQEAAQKRTGLSLSVASGKQGREQQRAGPRLGKTQPGVSLQFTPSHTQLAKRIPSLAQSTLDVEAGLLDGPAKPRTQ